MSHSSACGKLTRVEEVRPIFESALECHREAAEKEAVKRYIKEQTEHSVNSGTRSSGQTKVQKDGSVQKVSPYNPGDVIQVETYNKDGSIHYTTVNTETGVRHSYTATADGKIEKDHTTDQNVPKGHSGRH